MYEFMHTYCRYVPLTSLSSLQCGALSFIENVQAKNIKIPEEEFNVKMGYVNGKTDMDLFLEEGEAEEEEDRERIMVLGVRGRGGMTVLCFLLPLVKSCCFCIPSLPLSLSPSLPLSSLPLSSLPLSLSPSHPLTLSPSLPPSLSRAVSV